MIYYFDVTETYIKTVGIEAEDMQQARERVEELYDSKDIDLGGLPHNVFFECVQTEVQDLIDETLITPDEIETFTLT